jgi:hypothetical protein
VSLRIPKALYAQVQQRVHMRRMTLTEALLEGLELWLEQPVDPREQFLSDESDMVIQELREELKATLLDELRTDVQRLLVSATTSPVVPHDTLSRNGNTVLQKRIPEPGFDATRYRLGKLCPQGHAYQGTGQSLLRQKQGDCVECGKLAKRAQRARRKGQRAAQ